MTTMEQKVHKVKATNNTIDEIGYPKDTGKAIAEYIWNWFDARATRVNIDFEFDNLTFLKYFKISDNGDWIAFENFDSTFEPILDSPKRDLDWSFYTKWKKWRWRFSFLAFCDKVEWETTYKLNEDYITYQIKSASSQKDTFITNNRQENRLKSKWTTVSFDNFHQNINKDYLESEEFINYLKFEFWWFLHLNQSLNYKIYINWAELDFNSVIKITDDKVEIIEDNEWREHTFSFHYILWTNKIGEDCQNYYLNSKNKPRWQEDNWTNNKGDGFFNSLYVVSDYFDTFEVLDKKPLRSEEQISLLKRTFSKYDEIFKELTKRIQDYLQAKKSEFLGSKWDELIWKLYTEGVMPKFWTSKYEVIRKNDFEIIVKEIYIVAPQIFEKNNNSTQKKTILWFLKLLLDDDKRDYVLEVMKQTLDLTEEQEKAFCQSLKKTTLAGMVKVTNLIIGRKEKILQLSKLVFDLSEFTNERDHIQKIMEENYWIIGEQYNLTSADKKFSVLKSKYLELIGEKQVDKKSSKDDKRRPDIFLSRTRSIPSTNHSHNITEHIIVELKRPSQTIWKKQFRQIEDYMEYIKNDPQLASKLSSWKFYLIWKELETFVTDRYEEFDEIDDPFMVGWTANYRIYAMTWSDLFYTFENSHQHLLDELDLDESLMISDLWLDSEKVDRQESDKITQAILWK